MRILLVDDDEPLMEALASSLIEHRYAVDIAIDGEAALEYVALFNYDLIVLDLMLPKVDGITLCQQLREQGYTMPILMLTARDTSNDKITALDAGADDYVVKPFDFEELTARIRALSRRETQTLPPILNWGDLSLDPKTCQVTYAQKLVNLTPKEYGLLELLLRHPQQVFSPSAIIDNLWSFEDPPSDDAVRTHIKGLRQKLTTAGASRKTIETVYGIGYRLNPKIATVVETPSIQPTASQKATNTAAVTKAWKQFKQVAQERVLLLEQAAASLQTGSLNLELQQQAKSTAHKLAGSLGGFGFPEGSTLARKLEDLLQTQLSTQPAQIQKFTQLVSNLRSEIEHQPFEHTATQVLGKPALVVIVDDNSELTQPLVAAATTCGLRTQLATYSNVQDLLNQVSPAVILLKISFANSNEHLKLLGNIHQQQPSLPIAAIMAGGDFAHRLQIVRQGASLVWQESTTPGQIMTSIAGLICRSGRGAKILVVDDDPHFLTSLEFNLAHWDFDLTTLDDPQQFWQVLEQVHPDLLVLDVEMPQISGIELCQVLRSDPRWQQLPVLFLTVHQDEKTQHQAFAIGADDYVSKPVLGAELANRILNRLKRTNITKNC